MLKRESLRDQITNEIRSQIVSGAISCRENIVESELAQQLGVSRTPLREALITLEQEGFLCASPGKGFSVLPLSNKEYRDIVPIIGALERIALVASEQPGTEHLDELREINRQFHETDHLEDGEQRRSARVRLDIMWHSLLLERSTNEKALMLLQNLKEQWRRYEYCFFSTVGSVSPSVAEHEDVIRQLEKGNIEQAAELLEKQWAVCGSLGTFLCKKARRES